MTDATERLDRAGGSLLLVTAEARYATGDELIATNTETMIFRPVDPAADNTRDEAAEPAAGAPDTAGVADSLGTPAVHEPLPRERLSPGRAIRPLRRRIALPDMVAYGAATWDWHRLHYDEAHARRLGAPAPLVDGQMLGALLAECVLRAAGPGARLVRLSYRNRAPVRAGETVGCAGTIATSDDAGFSVDLSVSVGEQLVVAPAFAQLAWTSG